MAAATGSPFRRGYPVTEDGINDDGHTAKLVHPVECADVLVVVPTYNEAATLSVIVRRIRTALPACGILVVDDASPDGTGQLAEQLAASDPRLGVVHRPSKDGLGAAYMTGFRWGLRRGYQALVEIDADGSHQPEDLPRILAHLDRSDVVLGSRWTRGGQVRNWPKTREMLSRGANLYAWAALGLPLRDATTGFRAFHRRSLEGIGLHRVASQGYCFQIDLAWRAYRVGFRVVEVPITFLEREQGASKMDRQVVVESLWRVTAWGLGYRLQQLRTWRRMGRRPAH